MTAITDIPAFSEGEAIEMPLVEHAAMQLARACGIDAAQTRARSRAAFDVVPSAQGLGYQQMRVGLAGAESSLENALSEARLFGHAGKQASSGVLKQRGRGRTAFFTRFFM